MTTEDRTGPFLGCSELSTVMGLNPFENVGDLFLFKTGEKPPVESSLIMELGNHLEPYIIEELKSHFGWNIDYPIERWQKPVAEPTNIPSAPWLRHSPDAYGAGDDTSIQYEIKTTVSDKGWGEVHDGWGTIVPPHVHAQVQGQMYCSGRSTMRVARLLMPRDIRNKAAASPDHGTIQALLTLCPLDIFVVHYSPAAAEELLAAGAIFCEAVEKGDAALLKTFDLDALKALYATDNGAMKSADKDIIAKIKMYHTLGKVLKEKGDARKETLAELAALLKNASGFRHEMPDGSVMPIFTYKASSFVDMDDALERYPEQMEGCMVPSAKLFKDRHPELHESCRREGGGSRRPLVTKFFKELEEVDDGS